MPAKTPTRLPVVLTREEVSSILASLSGIHWLIGCLLYGTGMRIMEGVRLRIKDVDFSRHHIGVRDGKGAKDRMTMLPQHVERSLRQHLLIVRELHDNDLANGYGAVWLPNALARKYPNAAREWAWQICLSRRRPLRRPTLRRDSTASRRRTVLSARHASGYPQCRGREARNSTYPSALVRHASARVRLRHPDGPGTSRTSRRIDHDDLHARSQSRGPWGPKPARPLTASCYRGERALGGLAGAGTAPLAVAPISPRRASHKSSNASAMLSGK